MNDAKLVAIDESVEDRRDNVSCLSLGEPLLFQYLIEKLNINREQSSQKLRNQNGTYFTTSHEFDDEEEVLLVLKDIV